MDHFVVAAWNVHSGVDGWGRPFDVVLLDLTIRGGTGGREAIRRLKEIDPEVCAIVSSGYSDDPVVAEYRQHGFAGVLEKPYQLTQLGDAIRAVLAARSGD